MREINMKSILVIAILGLIGWNLWRNRQVLSAESLNANEDEALTEARDLYGSVILVEGQQSQNSLAYNQTGGYELGSVVHDFGQNYSGRIVG